MRFGIDTLILVLLASGIAGCDRELVVVNPEISGTLSVRGMPANGAEVLIGFSGDHDRPCAGVPVAAVVDADGRFMVPAKTTRMRRADVERFPGVFQNYVCFRYRDEVIVGSLLLTKPDEMKAYMGVCASPRTSTGYDDRLCRWTRRDALQ